MLPVIDADVSPRVSYTPVPATHVYCRLVCTPGSLHIPVNIAIDAKQCDSKYCCCAHVLLPQVSDVVSTVFGGASFDVLHLAMRQVSVIMTGVGGGCCPV